jgi:hypothetical protein
VRPPHGKEDRKLKMDQKCICSGVLQPKVKTVQFVTPRRAGGSKSIHRNFSLNSSRRVKVEETEMCIFVCLFRKSTSIC